MYGFIGADCVFLSLVYAPDNIASLDLVIIQMNCGKVNTYTAEKSGIALLKSQYLGQQSRSCFIVQISVMMLRFFLFRRREGFGGCPGLLQASTNNGVVQTNEDKKILYLLICNVQQGVIWWSGCMGRVNGALAWIRVDGDRKMAYLLGAQKYRLARQCGHNRRQNLF